MNLQFTKAQLVYWLPKALEGQPGRVDSDFLHTLWQRFPKGSSKIRAVIKDLSAVSLSPKDSAIDKLAELLTDQSFLSRWVTQEKKPYPSFLVLVSSYMEANEPNLGFYGLKKIGFLLEHKTVKNKYFPDLTKIPDVINLLAESALDERYLSLFIWKMLTESRVAKSKFPGEQSIQDFEKSFVEALKSSGLERLLVGALETDWKEKEPIRLPADIASIDLEVENQRPITKEVAVLPSASRCLIGEKLGAEVKELESKVERYNSNAHALLSKAKALSGEDEPVASLMQIRESSHLLEELSEDIKVGAAVLVEKVNESINQSLQKVGIVFNDKCFEKFRLTTSHHWFEAVLDRIKHNSLIFVILEEFKEPGLVRRLLDGNSNSLNECRYDELRGELELLLNRYRCLAAGLAAESEFVAAIKRNLYNLDWNIFKDKTLQSETWVRLADYYILTGVVDVRLGIAVHHVFNKVSTRFGNLLISQMVTCDKALIASSVNALSWLGLAQQEQLAKAHPQLRTLVALSQLDAYFKAVSNGNDYYIYWSTSPLSEIANTHSSLIVRGFFKSIYDIISAPGLEPLSTQSLALCVSSSQIGNAKTANEQVSLDAFTDELKEILAFRKKGGRTTYAHIWQAAYNEIFEPLLNCLHDKGVRGFVDAYEAWVAVFQIENRFDNWKAEIPEHLKKNSEYDKFLRNQVSLKTSEIEGWLNIYKSVTQKVQLRKVDPLAAFKITIDKVLKSSEQDCTVVRIWLESKAVDQKSRSNNYVCQSRDWGDNISFDATYKEIDAFHPRAFAKIIDGPVTYENIYTDDFVSGFGYGSNENLVEIYAANEIFEGYSIVANESSEEITPALDRRVEKLTDELAARLRQRMQAFESMKEHPHIISSLSEAQNYFDNQQWRLTEKALSAAEESAINIKENAKALEVRGKLLSKILKLGGDPSLNPETENSQLALMLSQLLETYQSRRVHVTVLEKLLGLNSTGFETQLVECLEYMDCLELYPTASVSEQVAYYLEQAVDPIYNELSRSRTLLATYVSQLRKLGKYLIINIRHDKNIFDENSNLISILIDTAEQWQCLSSEGKAAVDRILEAFIARGIQEPEEVLGANQVVEVSSEVSNVQPIKNEEEAFRALEAKAKEIAARNNGFMSSEHKDVAKLINLKAWHEVSDASLLKLKDSRFKSLEDLASWAVSAVLSARIPFSILELASVLRMINSKVNSSVVRFLHQDKSTRSQIGDLVDQLIIDMANGIEGANGKENIVLPLDALQAICANINHAAIHQESFRLCFEVDVFEVIGIRSYWESFTGDQKQAEARALFMYITWKFHSSKALAYCLTLSPIDLEQRKAEALARVAEEALISGNSDLLQGFFDLKKSIQAKPFQIFADLVLSNSMSHGENAAKLTLLGGLERHNDGTLRSVLRIEPRRVDSPDSISLKLPNNCPVRFANDTSIEKLNGPFFTGTSLPIAFKLLDEQAVTFSVEITCLVVSLTGTSSSFSQKIEFSIIGGGAFEPLTPDDIDDDFQNFPDAHMRGESYVPRVVDEQKIEKALFKSKTVRSIWISSPRRSGKTTMLYRILDAFSHKVNRDNLVVYLTLDEYFADSAAFNRWIWRRLRTFSPNRELRELYDDFEGIGRDLPFDSDTGTFIGELSNRLLSSRDEGARIIFLIDEVDRFAAMYFEGGLKKNTAVDILWQIRHTITDRRDIGMVFAGSSAAKQVFITDAESPFYNSIDHLELTPFSCKNKAMEEASRQIVEPHRIRFKYDLPRDSLEHLIWVCAGIPYYMKLVAGATFATAKQSHILKADVNEGLRALLGRNTGISKLDDMGGDPGSDDLRTTISIEKSTDAILAKAVLYSFADLHSPISGHKTYRGKISSTESRLISHYNISKPQVERGLDICIGLGLIRMIETESVPEIDFVIPILGESLRKSSGRLWANIDHELINLAHEGK